MKNIRSFLYLVCITFGVFSCSACENSWTYKWYILRNQVPYSGGSKTHACKVGEHTSSSIPRGYDIVCGSPFDTPEEAYRKLGECDMCK